MDFLFSDPEPRVERRSSTPVELAIVVMLGLLVGAVLAAVAQWLSGGVMLTALARLALFASTGPAAPILVLLPALMPFGFLGRWSHDGFDREFQLHGWEKVACVFAGCVANYGICFVAAMLEPGAVHHLQGLLSPWSTLGILLNVPVQFCMAWLLWAYTGR